MSRTGLLFASLVGLILIGQVVWIFLVKQNLNDYKQYLTSLTLSIIYCFALIVVAVPDGLKLIETVAISFSVRRLN